MFDNFLAKNRRSGVHGKPEVGASGVYLPDRGHITASNMDGMGVGITVISYYYL